MGSTGGGVWQTDDAGQSWANLSDKFFKVGSIGAIAVADSDPNVIYVGTGSSQPRGNISPGIGVYRSLDGGDTWEHVGLEEAGQIGRIRVHPRDPNLVYVAAMGHILGPTRSGECTGPGTEEAVGSASITSATGPVLSIWP